MISDLRLRIGDPWEVALSQVLTWAREVTAAFNAPAPRVKSIVIDTDALPLIVNLPRGGRPQGVQLVRAVEKGSTDGLVISGGSIEWDAQASGGIRLHALSALAASTRYNAVISVTE